MNLNLENIDDLFRDSIETVEITPSPSVKEGVKKRMFYRNLIKGTYFKIASSVIVLSIIGTVVFFNINDNYTNNIAQNQSTNISTISNKTTSNVSQKDVITQNVLPIEKQTASDEITNKKNSSNYDKNNSTTIDTNTDNNNTSYNSVSSNNNDDKKTTNNNELAIIGLSEPSIIPESDSKSNSNNIQQNNNNSVLTSKYVEKNIVDEHEQKGKENIVIDKTPVSYNNITRNNSSLTNNYTQSNTTKTEQVKYLDRKSLILLSNNNELYLPEIQIPDDTIGFTATGEEIIVSSNKWFVEINFSPNYSFSKYTVSNNENSALVDKLNSSSNSNLGYSFGIETGYQFKNISVIAGLNYTQINEKFNAEYENISIEDINYWEYNDYTQTIYDTTNYINIDSLMQGDSVLTQIIDSTEITFTDSTLASRTDSSLTKEKMKYVNQYTYIEIPLTIEYTFNRVGKFSPFVRTGIIAGLHIKTKGFTYSIENNQELVEASNTPYMKANFWLLFGAGARYNINDKVSVLIYPYYRYNINGIIDDKSYYKQSLNNMGIKFGVRYKF